MRRLGHSSPTILKSSLSLILENFLNLRVTRILIGSTKWPDLGLLSYFENHGE